MDIIVKMGYTFDYQTTGGDVGGFANINRPDELRVSVEEIGGSYHCTCKIDGIYIQIWCTSYEIRRII